MTNVNEETPETQIVVGPLVQVVLRGQEAQTFPFSDIALEGDDAATISDSSLIERVTRWLDVEEDTLSDYKVVRPETGNILVSPQDDRFGVAWNS